MPSRSITLLRDSDRSPVEATLHIGVDARTFVRAEREWMPMRLDAMALMLDRGLSSDDLPEHSHWNWVQKAFSLQDPDYLGLSIECEGRIQGLMLALTGKTARLPGATGSGLLYIDYIETAPWNAEEFSDPPQFRGIGSQLYIAAVRHSIDLGHAGRIGLHTLPQSEGFYRDRFGMQSLGADPDYQYLDYFELDVSLVVGILQR